MLADGVHFEQATCYQRYTVEIYLHYLVLAECSGWPVGEEVPAQVERMLDFLLAVRRPDGTLPQIGDSDGGCLLPLARRAVGDVRGIFSTAAAWFHRPDYAWAAGGIAPETLWLLGTKGLHAFSGLEPAPPAGPASRCFPEGGYAILRDAWDGGHQLILDGGPLGCPVSGAHGHADLLGLQCSAFGEPVIVDPGTGCYQGEPGWRDAFRSTSFHSTVTLDGLEQATPAGLFGWKERPTARLSNWQPGVEVEVAEALHDAWLGLPDPVQHRRRVFFLHRRFWVVVDDLAGSAEHDVQLRFQFAPIFVSQAPDGWMRARTSSGRGLFIRAFSLAPLEADIVEGRRDPPLGWVSDNYGHWQPAPQLIYRAAARLPLRIATVLFPAPEGGAHSPPVRPLFSAGGDLEGLACGEAAEEIRFDSATQKPADPPRVEEEKK